MIKLVRTDSQNSDFITLVENLDLYLKIVDGDDHEFYNQYNGIESLKNVVIAYNGSLPVACGAFKKYTAGVAEIKRMFVMPSQRGAGVGSILLNELESWSRELLYTTCILETGKKQIEAIALYKKHNYNLIANYGQYATATKSLCFEKKSQLNNYTLEV